MKQLELLRGAKSLADLATIIGVKPHALSYALYKMRASEKYTVFTIPKKRGGLRVISAPAANLRNIQRKLATILADIQLELEAARSKEQCRLSHGFKKGHSIVSNSEFHRNKRFVFNVDLKDFFPSINLGRVRGFLVRDRSFALDLNIATIIAQIACHKNELPQGSPCSPVISNLITHIMDIQLNKLATANRCSYTRYADDLTFSSNEKEFPQSIARLVRGSDDKWVAGYELVAKIYRSGFAINEYKTRMQRRNSRQDVTGLVVNEKINVRREYYDRARVLTHNLFSHGFCYTRENGRFEVLPDKTIDGILGFIDFVRKTRTAQAAESESGFKTLYGRYLDYRSFHGLARPRVICEGKTDSVYLKAAIKSLSAKYPYWIDPSRPDSLLLDFFGYSKRAEKYQALSGGGEQLNNLVREFRKRTSRFKIVPQSPVIMIVDNDSGSKGLFAHMTKILGKAVDGSKPYYHLFKNLYVVPVPKTGKKEAEIEDLFEDKILNEKIDGRSFDRSGKEKDASKWFGKNEFATKIVRAKRASIVFDNFEPLLDAIRDSVIDYSKRL